MALSPSLNNPQKSKMNMSVPQLLTPEEPLVDSFNNNKALLPPMHTVPSPPASPNFVAFNTAAPTTEINYPQQDGILYPDHNSTAISSQTQPLFEADSSYRWNSPERERSLSVASLSSSPRSRRDSRFSHEEKSIRLSHSISNSPVVEAQPVGPVALYNYWGVEYYRLMMAQMEQHKKQRKLPPVNASRVQKRDRYTQQQVSLLGRQHRIEKPRPVIKATPKPKAAKAAPSPRHDSHTKRDRRQALSPEVPTTLASWQQASAPKPRTRAAPSKKVDDKDYSEWASIEDFSPPTTSLDHSVKKLTATWNNSNSLNLDNDPDKLDLHPQELAIASTLRLKCNQYLASKRRIFAAKVKALKEGREFNKTSAQNCCTIDVNKASRLWMAFDGVGWFGDQWFQEYI